MKQLARFISFVTNPIFVLFPVPYLLVYRAGYGHALAVKWALFSLFFLFIAGIFVIYEVRMKVFSDMDVSKREQRPLLFGVLGGITMIYLFSLFILHAPTVLFFTIWGVMLGIVLVAFINTRVKASLHVSTITAVLLTIVYLYDLPIFLFLLIPIVGWARISIKRHTQKEVFVGCAFGILLTFLMYILLKYVYQFLI
jgi:hypothetical protein